MPPPAVTDPAVPPDGEKPETGDDERASAIRWCGNDRNHQEHPRDQRDSQRLGMPEAALAPPGDRSEHEHESGHDPPVEAGSLATNRTSALRAPLLERRHGSPSPARSTRNGNRRRDADGGRHPLADDMPGRSQLAVRKSGHDETRMAAKRRRRLIVAVVGAGVVIVLAAILGPYVYIHFIEGPAPAKLELPKSSATTTTSKGSAATSSTSSASSSLDGTGTWEPARKRATGSKRFSSARTPPPWAAPSKIWGSTDDRGLDA